LVQAVFAAAFGARSMALKQGRSAPLSSLVFRPVQAMFGGRLKVCFSGGGPISADVQNFIRVAFNVNLIQGYGLTETCAVGTNQAIDSCEDGVVGAPSAANEVRLVSCLDPLGAVLVKDRDGLPYLSTDRSHLGQPCLGRGEVWIRGPTVVPGYYMDEHKVKGCALAPPGRGCCGPNPCRQGHTSSHLLWCVLFVFVR
jgi:long-chain acyl-CoA synthetase